jgi:hypothetical protein
LQNEVLGGSTPVTPRFISIYLLQKARSKTTIQPKRNFTQSHNRNTNINNNNQFPPLNPNQPPVPIPANQQTSYSKILPQNLQSRNISEQRSTFLNEFKAMFNQNSMVLNMLSSVINKITP